MLGDIILLIVIFMPVIITTYLSYIGYFNPPDVKEILNSVCYKYNNSTIKCFEYTTTFPENIWSNEKRLIE